MLQAKKINASMIAVVVLSVLLAIAVSVGATMAWFASEDSATGVFGLTGAVQVDLNDKAELSINDVTLVPSHPVPFDVNAEIQDTNTPYIVRARFGLELIEGTDPGNAVSIFQEFLEFDSGVVATVGGVDYTWSEMDTEGWYYLQVSEGSYVVGTIHDEDYDVTEDPAMIGLLELSIANGNRFVPSNWGNEYANLKFDVTLEVQATQAEVYNGETTTNMPLTTTEELADIFELVFPPVVSD